MTAATYLKHEWSSYDRNASIELLDGLKCDRCGQLRAVLAIDTSELEYGQVKLCQPCLVSLFDNGTDNAAIAAGSGTATTPKSGVVRSKPERREAHRPNTIGTGQTRG